MSKSDPPNQSADLIKNAQAAGFMMGFFMAQSLIQQQVIDLQQQVIELQDREQTDEIHWHIYSDMLADNTPNPDTLELLHSFYGWQFEFNEKWVKPYLHPKLYTEIVVEMTRELSRRIAELESGEHLEWLSEKKTS